MFIFSVRTFGQEPHQRSWMPEMKNFLFLFNFILKILLRWGHSVPQFPHKDTKNRDWRGQRTPMAAGPSVPSHCPVLIHLLSSAQFSSYFLWRFGNEVLFLCCWGFLLMLIAYLMQLIKLSESECLLCVCVSLSLPFIRS